MINFKQVSCRLGEQQFCYDLQIPLGQVVAIMGASGSGKSTLLNLLAGFIQPQTDAAQILLGDQRVDQLDPAQRPVTSLFQEHNLFAHMSVFNNLALGIRPSLRLTADEIDQVEIALDQVGLKGLGSRLPKQLSGGQRQRVALGRALVRRKPLLLLDEPFSALDPALRQEMAALVKGLSQQHQLTVLLVTHEPKDALELAETVVFIADGRVHWQGPSKDFLQQKDSHIKAYLGQSC
ncbi:thiamine ABC transporter ATP-binding protein [Candidatus Njordibacter sp. Uisw_039]|uniref:thiamine ABC transporter ATP-binding protein n=1 Tax=Candidatus Njordibacter sp. Uisw_039 TaxID=3230972 RepID=UPI003A4009D5